MTTILVPKSSEQFYCSFCDYSSCRQSQYERHLLTSKHHKTTIRLQKSSELSCKKVPVNIKYYNCDVCGKKYKHHSSLWKHKKECFYIKEEGVVAADDKEIIKMLIKENSDFKNIILEVCKNLKPTTVTNNLNSNNKTFNLNVFLNETCKDAMNIMDFVDSVNIKLSDLEHVGKVGFVDGITNIIVKNLKELDVSKRPVHCSDLKREIVYVKDENTWYKENEKLKMAIKHVAHKNIQMIPEWKQQNPDYLLDEGHINDKYMQIVMKSMGGSSNQEDKSYEDKIMKNVVKSVIIEKELLENLTTIKI
jgi:hypothetical protein